MFGPMRTILHILMLLCVVAVAAGCTTYRAKYRRAELISFEKDYPRLLQSGDITKWDSVTTDKTEGTTVYVYKPGTNKFYKFDQLLTKEMAVVLTRDLENGEFILDTKGARKFIRGW